MSGSCPVRSTFGVHLTSRYGRRNSATSSTIDEDKLWKLEHSNEGFARFARLLGDR